MVAERETTTTHHDFSSPRHLVINIINIVIVNHKQQAENLPPFTSLRPHTHLLSPTPRATHEDKDPKRTKEDHVPTMKKATHKRTKEAHVIVQPPDLAADISFFVSLFAKTIALLLMFDHTIITHMLQHTAFHSSKPPPLFTANNN